MKSDRLMVTRCCLACLILLLAPLAASAQITAPRESAQISFGPLSIYPSVQLVDAGIDDNVFNDPDDPKQDVTLTVQSRVLAVLRLGLNELMFTSGSDYVWFKEYASERSSDANYAMRFNLSASRLKPYIGAANTRTRARSSTEIDARARRSERMAIAGTGFNLTERTAMTASVQWDDTSFDDGERFRGVELDDRLNSSGWTYSGGVRHAVTPFTTLLVNGVYRKEMFQQSHLRDAKAYAVTPAIEFSPEAVIRGSFLAGYEVFVPEDPELAENRGIVFEGSLNWSIASTTLFDLSLGRKVNYSYQDTQPYYLQTGVRLSVTQRLFGPLSVQGSADRQHLAYRWKRGVSPTPGSEDRVDTADILSGGAVVSVGRGFSVLIGVEKTRRHSSEDTRQNFSRTRLLSTVTVGK